MFSTHLLLFRTEIYRLIAMWFIKISVFVTFTAACLQLSHKRKKTIRDCITSILMYNIRHDELFKYFTTSLLSTKRKKRENEGNIFHTNRNCENKSIFNVDDVCVCVCEWACMNLLRNENFTVRHENLWYIKCATDVCKINKTK